MKKPEHKTYTFWDTAWIFKWKFWFILAWAALAYLIVELNAIEILIGN